MVHQVYWPSDLVRPNKYIGQNAIVVGQNLNNKVLVAVTTIRFNKIQDLMNDHIVRMNAEKGDYELSMENQELEIIGVIGKNHIWWDGVIFQIDRSRITCSDGSRMIIYDPPNPTMMQFYSIDPITISLPEKNEGFTKFTHPTVEQIKQHGNYEQECSSANDSQFQDSITMINNCWKKRKELLNEFPVLERNWGDFKLWRVIMNKVLISIFFIFKVFLKLPLKPIKFITLCIIVGLRHIALIFNKLLNHKISPNAPSLIELSATAQQIDLRLQQFCYYPIQYIRTTRQIDWNPLTGIQSPVQNSLPIEQYPEYIRFYNTLWLVVNDVTLGITIGAFLIDNQDLLIHFFKTIFVTRILHGDLKKISMWLMTSPGGIKLNNELSMFFSELFTWMIEFWKISLVDLILPNLSKIFYVLAFSSTFGATLTIAVFSDFLSIITFHIYCFYFASARIFNWQLGILSSLFHLFCGQKKNILRNRIDSNDYDLDQLLLGTLLFTVLIFLLPTVFAFYITFTIARISILIIVGSLEILMSCLNHFPIFLILLKLKDCKRTPGGIEFSNEGNYLRIKSKPLALSEMFKPFANVLSKLKNSYFSVKTLKKILLGYPINVQRNKFYKMLYSALPSEAISTSELWSEIQECI